MCTWKIDLSEVSQCPPNNNTQKAVALIGTAMLGLLTAWSDFIWVFLCLRSNLYHPNHPLLKVWWRVAHLFHIQETIATDVIPLPSVRKWMASVTLKDNRWDGWFGSSTRNGKLQTHLPKHPALLDLSIYTSRTIASPLFVSFCCHHLHHGMSLACWHPISFRTLKFTSSLALTFHSLLPSSKKNKHHRNFGQLWIQRGRRVTYQKHLWLFALS